MTKPSLILPFKKRAAHLLRKRAYMHSKIDYGPSYWSGVFSLPTGRELHVFWQNYARDPARVDTIAIRHWPDGKALTKNEIKSLIRDLEKQVFFAGTTN